MSVVPRHRLTADQWHAAAAGRISSEVVDTLLRTEYSRQLLLAAALIARHGSSSADLRDALGVFSAAQQAQPDEVAALCRRSWFGAWVSTHLDVEAPEADARGALESRAGALAAVAAQLAGLSATTTTRVAGGFVQLPGRGRIATTTLEGSPVTVKVNGGEIVAHLPEGEVRVPLVGASPDPRWQALRTVGDDTFHVDLDDLDPLRDRFAAPVAARLPVSSHRQWSAIFAACWRLLERYLPEQADQLRLGLQVLVPLRADTERRDVSVTSSQQLGAIAATPPREPARFMVTLVHEWAHSVLNGLMSFTPLVEPAAATRHFVPWRPDPRPLPGVIHGIFAFTAVAEAWAALCADPNLTALAARECAVYREQVSTVLDELGTPAGLTAHGQLLLAVLRGRRDALAAVPVGAAAAGLARDRVAAARVSWLRRYG